jgi:phage tail sheath gpL-like
MPVIAADNNTSVTLTAKWEGASANDIFVEVLDADFGVEFAVVQLASGSVNPDVNVALNQIGNVWETVILNCLDVGDTAALDKYATFGEGRWGALNRKPLIVFSGNTATTVTAATTVSDARSTDRTNVQLVSPGSKDLPFIVAARQLARIVVVANNNPPHDYGWQRVPGLTPGDDGDQWTYAQRDQALKKGSSTIEVVDQVVRISDVVTFYHPTGVPIPAYRYVVDVVRMQNILFNLGLIFDTDEWAGAPLIPDDQPTVNPSAKKPKTAVAAVAALLDTLGLNAIISDPETAKKSIVAGISSSNPKRLDVSFTVQLSGNANIISVDFNFGFLFGTAPIVA